jgi:acyl-CoA synthetase (AMP-forming)/AMP-acid ligase II
MSLVGLGEWRGTRDHEAAVVFEDEPALTWAQLDALLNRSINALLARDVGPDRRIAVFAQNHPNTVVAYLTGILAGCSGVPINYHLRSEECAYILRDSGARLLFVGPENLEAGLEAAALAGGIPVVAWGIDEGTGAERWEEFLASGSDDEPPDDLRPLPYLYYTSGTTGFPKGTQSVPNPLMGDGYPTSRAQVEALTDAVPPEIKVALTMAPLYHFAQIGTIKRAVLVGRTLVLYKRFDAERTLRAIQEYRINYALMVPAQLVRLLALPDEARARYDLSSLVTVITGAAPCALDVKQRILEWFGPVFGEGYGATEIGGLTWITSEEWLEHPGSVGKVNANFKLFVVDAEGNELGPNEVGALYFEDMDGKVDLVYYEDEEKTAAAHLRPGVWTLGDLGYVDDEGYLFLTGRFADMVNSGGVKIYPVEAEQVMMELPGVADVACIGVPHLELGEVLHALVVPADQANPPAPEELIAQTQERLSKFKCPRAVEFVADIGRMPTGKLNKNELRKRYEAGEVRVLRVADTAANAG